MTTPVSATPSRRALLIGIDSYRTPDAALTGCVNDVELMRDVLVEHFQFPAENVTLLTNADATRAGILSALSALHDTTRRDDNVVIHYAGHGSQMTDREGDEPSGLDATWHPVDSNAWDPKTQAWVGENRDITDDEIAIWIHKFAEVTKYLTIVVDACHSGGISRDSGNERSRGTKPDDRPVSELPPSPVGPLPKATDRSASGWGGVPQSYALIAGCRSEEKSMEVNPSAEAGRDKAHGALTWFLARNLREAEAGTTYRDVFEMATAQVTREKPGQHPQMEGQVDRTIFGITDLPVAGYRLVTARNDRGELTLRGGATHQVTVGSHYAIYPPGAKNFTGGTVTPIGEAVVTTVNSTTSLAQIVEGSERTAGIIAEMCRAVELTHEFGAQRFDVAVAGAGSEVDALKKALASSVHVGLATSDANVAARAEVRDGAWQVADANGKRMAPATPAADVALVLANIETVSRWSRLRALENPDPGSVMRTRPPMRVDLMRWKGNAWVPATTEADGKTIVFDDGERIAFSVKKAHERDLFFTLLDLDPTGAVVRVWPDTTVDALTGSSSFLVAPGPGDEPWTIGFPDGEPMEALRSSDDRFEYVDELWMLLVTMQPADFKDYEQPGTFASAAAHDGSMSRAIRKGPPKLDDDWTVVRQPMRIRRKK